MPIYEYQCSLCQHEFETLQKISDEPLSQCPSCDESGLVKKVSAAAFRLSGSGWYETDFKQSKQKNLAGDQKQDSNQSKTGESSTADGKKEQEVTKKDKDSSVKASSSLSQKAN